jgi:hypothetical protein
MRSFDPMRVSRARAHALPRVVTRGRLPTVAATLAGTMSLAASITGAAVPAPSAMALSALAAAAVPAFTAGDLAVLRIGDGTTALSGAAAPVFVDEYTPTGSLIQSIALPTEPGADGTNARLTDSGSASSDGGLTLSADGTHLALGGYDAPVGTAAVVRRTNPGPSRSQRGRRAGQ